jgi:hypothetical protein
MNLLWRVTLALTTECVSMVTVAMVTWLWLDLYSDNLTFIEQGWGLFTSLISMVTACYGRQATIFFFLMNSHNSTEQNDTMVSYIC